MIITPQKRAQSEVITTVLMVLIGIVAVGVLSTFVIGFVRDNLKSSDCIGIQGKITLDMESGFTFFNITSNNSYVVVKNEWTGGNITGINIILDDGIKSKTYEVRAGAAGPLIRMYDLTLNITVPQSNNPKETYWINSSRDFKTTSIKKVLVVPVLKSGACNEAPDEKVMPTYP